MKRKIYDHLLLWKNKRKGKSALMIEGARRVGKSYIVREFAQRVMIKSTLEFEYMVVRFHRNYYMLRFDKARPLYDLVKEKGQKRVKSIN